MKIAATVYFCFPMSNFHTRVGIELPAIPGF